MRKTFKVAMLIGLAAACKTDDQPSHGTAQPQNRYILGTARDIARVPLIDEAKINVSMAYRRAKAWELARAVLDPVNIPENFPITLEPGTPRTLPLWATWYDSKEMRNISRWFFTYMSENTGGWEVCSADPRCVDRKIDEALRRNVASVNWNFWGEGYFESYLGQLKKSEDLAGFVEQTKPNGASEKGFTLFSPSIIRHYLRNFASIIQCKNTEVTRKPAPYRTPCFAEEFPTDAVAIKVTWARIDSKIAEVDTTPAGLREIFRSGDWFIEGAESPTVPASKAADAAFVMQARDLGQPGKRYVLTGMHIASKILPDWFWVSLWWGKNPDEDFGADRPSTLAQEVGPAWKNYKMCTVSGYAEGDINPTAEFRGEKMATLTAALATTHELDQVHTWCSNSFIETTDGHGPTNCIGCHQHAGTEKDPTSQPYDPAFGRGQTTQSIPGDYLWSFEAEPDNFREILTAEAAAAGITLTP